MTVRQKNTTEYARMAEEEMALAAERLEVFGESDLVEYRLARAQVWATLAVAAARR